MKKSTVLLADDHKLVRAGLRSLVEKAEDFEVVGEASDGREALERVNQLQPDIVLLDIAMPELNGLEVTERIARYHKQVKIF